MPNEKSAAAQRWREQNRQRSNATAAAGLARRRAWLAEGDVTEMELVALWNRSKGQCAECGAIVHPRFSPLRAEGFDHIVSRTNGGRHTISNLRVLCGLCNRRKAAKD